MPDAERRDLMAGASTADSGELRDGPEPPSHRWFRRYLWGSRLVFSLALVGSLALYVSKTLHWQVIWDTGMMHYINFLMSQGLTPYRDIFDNNLPAAYFMEGWAMQVFGGGDLGWRIYDFLLAALLIGSAMVIAWPYDWFAGLFAGTFFTLIHGCEGPRNAVQREQVMTTLIMAGYALLFTAMRRRIPWLMLPFGLLLGLAASLKPTVAPLGVVLLAAAAYVLYRRGTRPWAYLGYGLLGLLLAALPSLAFLAHYQALGAFVAISKRLTTYYAGIGAAPIPQLFGMLFGVAYLRPLVFGVVLMLLLKRRGRWENWERTALLIGVAFGMLSFLAQRKAFDHHLYAYGAFVLLWAAIEVAKAWNSAGWRHVVGLLFFLFFFIGTLPVMVTDIDLDRDPARDGSRYMLQASDLTSTLERLGGRAALQQQVQCFDVVEGCFDALYRLRLLPYSRFMGDYMLLPPPGAVPLAGAREEMMADFARQPPKVIVETDLWLTRPPSFRKFDQWSQLERFIAAHYVLEDARSYGDSAYKVYVWKPAAGGR